MRGQYRVSHKVYGLCRMCTFSLDMSLLRVETTCAPTIANSTVRCLLQSDFMCLDVGYVNNLLYFPHLQNGIRKSLVHTQIKIDDDGISSSVV